MPYLPVYKLGPFRILVTFIGVVLAFIFTVFPYPVTSRDLLRQDVAQQFHLLSKMYSLTQARLNAAVCSNTRAIQHLRKSMGEVSLKCIGVQARSSDNLMYASWEPNLRYRFPKGIYSELLSSLQRYPFHRGYLISSIYDMYVIQNDAISRLEGDWLRAMTTALGKEFFESVANQTISLLTILAGALTLDAPIPPFLSIPRAALFRVLMAEREPEEMSLQHVGETGYAVFAAMSVSSQFADQEVERCIGLVRSLVGEVDLQWDEEAV